MKKLSRDSVLVLFGNFWFHTVVYSGEAVTFNQNKLVRAKMRPKEGAKIELLREIFQILSDLSDLQV